MATLMQSIAKYSRMGLASPFANMLSLPEKLLKQKQVASSKSFQAAKSIHESVIDSTAANKNSGHQQQSVMAVQRRENRRCARIIRYGLHNNCLNQAYVFAFDIPMTADQAIASLMAAKLDVNAGRPGVGQRASMASFSQVRADSPSDMGRSNPPASTQETVNQIIAAAAKARGKPYNANETIAWEIGLAHRTHAGDAAAVVSTAANARGETFNSIGDQDDITN
jgi:hypothetical protein